MGVNNSHFNLRDNYLQLYPFFIFDINLKPNVVQVNVEYYG